MRPETGALWVVPGTHKQVIAEVPGDGFAGRPFVLERNFEPSDGIAVDLRPGQFILFHNLLVHGSLPTATTRLAWTTRYVTPDTRVHPRGTVNPQGQNLQRYGALLVAGRDRPRTNVLRAPPLTGAGSLVEETGVAP
jgi:ectoine hydroxylase-related dioxygenase (phytanoyl-CoA dioxygenase family)